MTIDHDHDQKLKFKIFRAVCTFAMLSLIVEISYTFTTEFNSPTFIIFNIQCLSVYPDHHMVCPVPYRKVGSREVGKQYTRGGALERFNQHFLMWFSRVRPHRIARKVQVMLYVILSLSIQPVMCVRVHWTLDSPREAAHLGRSNNTLKVQGFWYWPVSH